MFGRFPAGFCGLSLKIGVLFWGGMPEVAAQQAKRWTYEEYYRLDDDRRYEIIDGALLMAPSPTDEHQDWGGDLFLRLAPFVKRNKLGRVFIAFDVILDEENTVQPDLIFVSTSKLGIIQRRGIFGVPDLLVEIISPSTVRRDRYEKKELYARFGVTEYWVVDPANSAVEILTLQSGAYHLHCSAEEKGVVSSPLLAGFSFDVSELAKQR